VRVCLEVEKKISKNFYISWFLFHNGLFYKKSYSLLEFSKNVLFIKVWEKFMLAENFLKIEKGKNPF